MEVGFGEEGLSHQKGYTKESRPAAATVETWQSTTLIASPLKASTRVLVRSKSVCNIHRSLSSD